MPRLTEPWQEEEIIRCVGGHEGMSGIEYWLRTYVVTYDEPNETVKPYPCWDYQLEYMRELEQGGKILVEKPRDMMITWSTCLFALHCLLFRPNWTGFCISRRENEVDDGGMKSTCRSIMGRIRFTYERLPEWMQGDVTFSMLKIVNNEKGMNSTITGEATKPTSGQSISCTFKWADEISQVDQSEKVHASMTGGNFQTLLYTSISNLMGNAFARLRHDENSGFRVLTYEWHRRPDRDQAWYERKIADLTPIERAKQVDIGYRVMSPATVFQSFDALVHVLPMERMLIDGERYVIGFDEGFSQPGAMYLAVLEGERMRILYERYETGIHVRLPEQRRVPGDEDWVDIAWQMEKMVAPALEEGKHIVDAVCVGWSSGASKKAQVDAVAAHFEVAGFRTYTVVKDKHARIRAVNAWLRLDGAGSPYLTISNHCEKLVWEMIRWEYKVVGDEATETPRDNNDHGCEALCAICEYVEEPKATEKPWVSNVDSWAKAGVANVGRRED